MTPTRRTEDRDWVARQWRRYNGYFHIIAAVIATTFASGICWAQYTEIRPKLDNHELRIIDLEKDRSAIAAMKQEIDDIHEFVRKK